MTRRPEYRPRQPKHSFWKKVGNFYYCEKADLEKLINDCVYTDAYIQGRMGNGYKYIGYALAGQGLELSNVTYLEDGLDNDRGPMTGYKPEFVYKVVPSDL
ncbi:MAG: hypothetical protein JNL11_02145 [Bdellovibrionaceae bacterium]|nr:hypothetical protein [Pseudobdellovibrionaceae bacterium]